MEGRRRTWRIVSARLQAAFCLTTLFLAIVVPVVLISPTDSRYSYDERLYHEPTVRLLASKWPAIDVTNDPKSAISPGYHYFLATLCQVMPLSTRGLRLANALVSLAASLALFSYAGRRIGPRGAMLWTLPFLLDPYYLKSAAYLVTDNASLLFFVLTGNCLLASGKAGASVRAGIYAACATAVRQNYVWLAGGLLARCGEACLSKSHDANGHWIRKALWAAIGAAMPLGLVGYLIWSWHGLTPPAWQEKHTAFSLFPLVFALALVGLLGSFYLPVLGRSQIRRSLADRRFWAIAASVACLALLPQSDYSYEAGRWGGWLWAVVERTGTVFHRWPMYPPLAVLGAFVIFAATSRCSQLGRAQHLPIIAALALAWVAAQCTNKLVFQRYFEPTLLIFLTWLFLPSWQGFARPAALSLSFLALLNLSNTLLTLVGSIAR